MWWNKTGMEGKIDGKKVNERCGHFYDFEHEVDDHVGRERKRKESGR